jgi:hypothetical protein
VYARALTVTWRISQLLGIRVCNRAPVALAIASYCVDWAIQTHINKIEESTNVEIKKKGGVMYFYMFNCVFFLFMSVVFMVDDFAYALWYPPAISPTIFMSVGGIICLYLWGNLSTNKWSSYDTLWLRHLSDNMCRTSIRSPMILK